MIEIFDYETLALLKSLEVKIEDTKENRLKAKEDFRKEISKNTTE